MKRNIAIKSLVILSFAGILLTAGCSGKHVPAWEEAEAANTMEAYESYLAEYPEAPNLEEARTKMDDLVAAGEMENLYEHMKNFLNGDEADNVIASFSGLEFSARDQNRSSGMTMFGTSSMLVQGTISFPSSDVVLSLTYEPTPNQMIARIEEITFEEGMELVFNNGHHFVYENETWARR